MRRLVTRSIQPGSPGSSYVLVTTTRGFDCLHPLDSRRVVTFGYGERRIGGTPSLLAPGQPVADEGQAFLRSVQYTPVR